MGSATGQGLKPDMDEAEVLLLELEVHRLMTFNFEAYLYRDQIYLPAIQLFSILKLPYSYKEEGRQLQVHFPTSDRVIRINAEQNRVRGLPPSITISGDDYMIGSNEIYLRREWMEQAFGFTLLFDYSKLSLMLFSSEELPVVRDYRRRKLYGTLQDYNSAIQPDVIQPAKHHLMNGWIANWTLNTSHSLPQQDYSYGLGLGGQLLGGDLTLQTKGSREYGFQWDQIRGRWSYPVYHSAYIQQLSVGDQSQQDVMSGNYLTYRGASITNRPKVPRRVFDTYQFTNSLPEGWDAELYVNNRLSGIAIGTEQDSLNFSMPLRYGSNMFELQYYDPQGMDHQQRFLVHIPQEFLPRGKVEYELSAGRYRNLNEQLFAHAALKWGLSSHATLGGGLRYSPPASPFSGEKVTPFVQAWARISHRLIVEASHAHGSLSQGSLRYTLPTMTPLRLNVKKYQPGSRYNKFGKSLEASLSTSIPLQLPFMKLSTFLSTDYAEYQNSRSLSLYGGTTSSLPAGLLLRWSSQVRFITTNTHPLEKMQHISKVQLSKRLLRRLLLRPGIRYDHGLQKITRSQLEVSTRISGQGYLSLSVQRSHQYQHTSLFLRFTLNLPYARHNSYVSNTQAHPTLHQSTSGTVAIDQNSRFYTDGRSWMGTAAARIDPFLDLNDNGRKDKAEPVVKGLKANFYESGGNNSPIYRNRQLASHLAPYRPYIVEIDASSLDNPLWVPSHTTYRLQVNPHMVNSLPVPILVSGEAAGSVRLQGENNLQNHFLSGLKVYLSGPRGGSPDTLRTYTNGAFFHVGLRPGHYTAALDRQQLASLSLRAVRDSVKFVIEPTTHGDIVDDINLTIALDQPEDDRLDVVYTIQIGAFGNRANATSISEKARELTQLRTNITYDAENALYKCHLGLFSSYDSAIDYLYTLQRSHPGIFEKAFVVDMEIEQ